MAFDADVVAVSFADTLVVSAGLLAGSSTPQSASLVTRIDLDEQSGFGDVTDLLGSVAGLQMARLGGWGASAVPSLRGSAPAQIRFFLDGVPLPDAQSGMAGFSRIPLDRLQAIEVHRGVVPAGFGGVGGAGAINFITRDQDEGVDATLQAGSFGELGARVTAGATSGDDSRHGLIMVHGHRADNDYAFLDHNQTFHRDDDDTVRVRRNAWVEEYGAWGSGRWQMGQLTARGSLGYARRDGGRPGALGYESQHASVRYDRWDGQMHVDWAAGLVQAVVAGGRGNEFLFDPAGEMPLTPPGTTHAATDDLFTRLAWSPVLISDVLSLAAGMEWRGEWQTETIASVTDPERSRKTTSAWAALNLDLGDGRLRVAPAWRWQQTRDNFPAQPSGPLPPWLRNETPTTNTREDVSPSLGAVWALQTGRLFLESHAAQTVRIPTWVELFGHRGGINGNRNLMPETITSVDVALSANDGGGLSGRVAAFYAETEDKIIFVQNSQRTSKAINLGRTLARGVEVEVAWQLTTALGLSGNLTTQKVENRDDDPDQYGKAVPLLPEVEAHGRLNGRVGRWRPWLEVAHMGANYRDRANTELDKAPARTLINLGLGRDWTPSWLGPASVLSLLGEVINLTDNSVYDVEGFPLPGRSWHLAVRVRR